MRLHEFIHLNYAAYKSQAQIRQINIDNYLLVSIITDRSQLKCDDTHAETRFGLSAKQTTHLNRQGGGGRQFSRLLAAEVWRCAHQR